MQRVWCFKLHTSVLNTLTTWSSHPQQMHSGDYAANLPTFKMVQGDNEDTVAVK